MSYYSDDEVLKQQSLIKYFKQGFTFVEKKAKMKEYFFEQYFPNLLLTSLSFLIIDI